MALVYRLSCLLTILFVPASNTLHSTSQHDAYAAYYANDTDAVYGYATRYGDDTLALDELLWSAREHQAQRDHGFALLGGGYGYHTIGGKEYLADNRASHAYALLRDLPKPQPTANQQRLAALAAMTDSEARAYVTERYVGIISTRSPNDIGREWCLLAAPGLRPVGLVIVGGTAALHDWTDYGESVNDFYGHLRIGRRVLQVDGVEWYWVADLANSAYAAVGGYGNRAILVALGPAWLCDNPCGDVIE